MYIFRIIFFIGLILFNLTFANALSFDMTDDAQEVNEKIEYESSKISNRQQKAIVKFLGLDKPLDYSISGAENYCHYIKDSDGRYGCLAGIKLAREDISGAENYCHYLRDSDSRYGCLAGIKLAREDINGARNYCHYLKDNDSRYGCLSDVSLTGYFLKEKEKISNEGNEEIYSVQQEIYEAENKLETDKSEALQLLQELESCPECMEDDEDLKELYLQLKGEM